MQKKKYLSLSLTVMIIVGAITYAAAQSTFQPEPLAPIFSDREGLAIRGTDPVAYFTDNKAVKGDPNIAHDWQGAKWLFASAKNRDAFAKQPEKYAPQYGGY